MSRAGRPTAHLLQALGQTMSFFDTQRVGYLPANNTVAWRGSAFTADYNTSATLATSLSNDSMLGFGGVRGAAGGGAGALMWTGCISLLLIGRLAA